MTRTVTARGRRITVTRRGNHITLAPGRLQRLRHPLARGVRFPVSDVRCLRVHEPRWGRMAGWVEFVYAIDLGADTNPDDELLSHVTYGRGQRREFAALIAAGGWRYIDVV